MKKTAMLVTVLLCLLSFMATALADSATTRRRWRRVEARAVSRARDPAA